MQLEESGQFIKEQSEHIADSETRLSESQKEISEFETLMNGLRDNLEESNQQRAVLQEKLTEYVDNTAKGLSDSSLSGVF